MITVQLRYDNWVTEMQTESSYGKSQGDRQLALFSGCGLSCFADLALVSPGITTRRGGIPAQCVITLPQKGAVSGRNYFKMPKEEIVRYTDEQVRKLFLPQGEAS